MSTNKEKFNKKYGQPKDASNSMRKIARLSGINIKILNEVKSRGMGAFNTNRAAVRPSVTSAEQWGIARVYSFVMGGKTRTTADKDLWEKHKKK